MSSSCPHCGAAVEFAGRDARILNGTCADCHGTFTIVEDGAPAPDGVRDAPAFQEPSGVAQETRGVSASTVSCADCGTPVVLRSTSNATIEAACPVCRTTRTYLLDRSLEGSDHGRRPGFARSGDEGRRRFNPASARPCRECGGPLRFSTAPDGTVTGECVACGNRFSLGPRRRAGPAAGRWGGRGDREREGGFRRYQGSRGRPGGGAPRGGARYGDGSRPFRRRSRPSEGDEPPEDTRRRRRPRTE